ncbi:MAG: hypothetical protein J1E04_03820, partial [Alistipes sp.]|nr:hypothetical protein [Alistipes sp.]
SFLTPFSENFAVRIYCNAIGVFIELIWVCHPERSDSVVEPTPNRGQRVLALFAEVRRRKTEG